jgi:hypothetical protein
MEPCVQCLPLKGGLDLSNLLIFPIKAFFELGYEDFEPRVAVDCFELEMPELANSIACSRLAADHSKKKDNTMIGFFRTKLGRVLAGLVKELLVGLGIMPMRKK